MNDHGGEVPDPAAGADGPDAESRPVLAEASRILSTFAHARPMAVSDTAYADGTLVKLQDARLPVRPACSVRRCPVSVIVVLVVVP